MKQSECKISLCSGTFACHIGDQGLSVGQRPPTWRNAQEVSETLVNLPTTALVHIVGLTVADSSRGNCDRLAISREERLFQRLDVEISFVNRACNGSAILDAMAVQSIEVTNEFLFF